MTIDGTKGTFPFSAVVGQDDARLALLLATVDPALGGVLLRGEKGSAKSTLARGLASLLPDHAPFVELPVGATEDRVLGSLDLRAALTDGPERFRPGLLAAAHGGVLYVDEVNLLPDHLVDAILDAAASGVHRVERDGISHEHPARFVLLGSMNPEEGELRPQLLDRFGLSVEVRSPQDPALRAEAVRRRLAHDAGQPLNLPPSEPGGPLATPTQPGSAPVGPARPFGTPTTSDPSPADVSRPVETPTTPVDLVRPVGMASSRVTAAGVANPGGAHHAAGAATVTGGAGDDELRRRLVDATPASLPDDVIEFAARLAVNVGAESLRADLVLCRAAAALAGWEKRSVATEDDVARVAPLALGHRHRRRPFDPPTLPPEDLSDALDQARSQSGSGSSDADDPGESESESESEPGPQSAPTGSAPERRWDELAEEASKARMALESLAPPPLYARDQRQRTWGARASRGPGPVIEGGPGPTVGHRMPGPGGASGAEGIAVVPTVRAAMQRRRHEPDGPALAADDVRVPRRVRKQSRTIVLVVDASGSMGTTSRVTAATGAVLGLLADAYLRRDQVALVAFRGEGATEVLPPTASVELARSHLRELPTGGATPLAEGLETALRIAQRVAEQGSLPLLVVLTDGRATGTPDALDRAREVSRAIATAGVDTVVLDAEDGNARLGLAAELVALMDGRYLHLAEVTAAAIETAVRTTLDP